MQSLRDSIPTRFHSCDAQERVIFLAGTADDALMPYLPNESLSEAVKGPRIERRLTRLRLGLGLQSDLVRRDRKTLFY